MQFCYSGGERKPPLNIRQLEAFKAMDIMERTKLARENPDAYKRLSDEARGA